MGLDVCVHGVYGVEVPARWHTRLVMLLQSVEEAIHRKNRPDDWADYDPESWMELYFENADQLREFVQQESEWAEIVAALKAPPDVSLFWSGYDDHRMGRDEVEPGKLLLGYGLYSFPRQVPDARWKPDWMTWAEAY